MPSGELWVDWTIRTSAKYGKERVLDLPMDAQGARDELESIWPVTRCGIRSSTCEARESVMAQNRRYVRVDFFCRVDVAPISGGKTIEARSANISLGGVGLIVPQSLELGQVLQLTFHLRDREGNELLEQIAGRVVNSRSDFEILRVGIEFLEPLKESKNPVLCRTVERL
jgi:hypothetical protein